jgi:hypothetical protein
MLVLLDQGTPVPLGRFLLHHTVRTVHEKGWATLGKGEVLTAAEAEGFHVFVTTDKNLRHQQNLAERRIAIVVVMHAQWPRLEPHADLVVAAIDRATPRTYAEVDVPVADLSWGSEPCGRFSALWA